MAAAQRPGGQQAKICQFKLVLLGRYEPKSAKFCHSCVNLFLISDLHIKSWLSRCAYLGCQISLGWIWQMGMGVNEYIFEFRFDSLYLFLFITTMQCRVCFTLIHASLIDICTVLSLKSSSILQAD